VDDDRVLSILRAADAATTLPRFGGMARPQGVFIGTEAAWAFANVDGSISTGPMPRILPTARRIPILRGLVRLAGALLPVFARGQGGAARERPVFASALALPLAFAFLPELLATALGVLTSLLFIAWLFRGRTLFLHGAEHRAIAAAERRELVATWTGNTRPSRFALRCGTNFAALALPLTFLVQEWWPFAPAPYTPIVLTAFSLGLAMELWQAVHAGPRHVARALLVPGLVLQRLTTREPTLDETRVALRAVAATLATT
jgi:uncharacterized protein YqhQ